MLCLDTRALGGDAASRAVTLLFCVLDAMTMAM